MPIPSRADPAWWAIALAVFVTAFAARIVPLLRGGGLFGTGDYDEGVHYASAVGLVSGLLPYRDFLFLQPPGIVLLLAPFALLGNIVGDPLAMALARLTWITVGSLSAVLAGWLLRPLGRTPALVGGLFYALFMPGTYDRTTLLEGPQSTLYLLVLLLISPAGRRRRHCALLVLAGALLGFAIMIKIWAVAAAIVIVGWLLLTRSWRTAAAVIAGVAAGGTAVGLPFLLAAPRQMWLMVVADQLGRPWSGTITDRMVNVAGTPLWGAGHPVVLAVALAVLAVLLVLAFTVREGRLPGLLFLAFVAVLLASPMAFAHYGGLVAAPGALVAGAGTAGLLRLLHWIPAVFWRAASAAVVVALLAAMVAWSGPLWTSRSGSRFPAAALRPAVAAVPGCVTTDNPIALIELDLLRRNLLRNCRYVVDLSGHSYHPPLLLPGVKRTRNPRWQRFALDYLRSGDATIPTKGGNMSSVSAATIRSWPVLARAGKFVVRRPLPAR